MWNVQKVNWDSDFFGLSIGKLHVPKGAANLDDNSLNKVKSDYDLLYIYSNEPIIVNKSFEDCKIVLSHKVSLDVINELNVNEVNIFPYKGGINEQLLSLAFQSGEFSRFNLDPNFKEDAFYRLYKQWLKSSLDGRLADEIFVMNDNDELLKGFVTLSNKESYCEIGLLAVSAESRGQGIGRKLIQKSLRYAFENGYQELRVPTQERNVKALGFYTSNNFTVIEKTYIYHYWL